MAKSIASLFSGVSGIDDSALNAFKTPEQVREEQLDKLRERSTAQATLLGGIGQRASTALPGIFGSFAASQLPEMAVDLNQATRRGLLGAGSIAGAAGRPGVQQALQQAAVSPEERQAGATQEALRQLQGSSPEEMMAVARELQQRGNVQGAQIIMQMAREAQPAVESMSLTELTGIPANVLQSYPADSVQKANEIRLQGKLPDETMAQFIGRVNAALGKSETNTALTDVLSSVPFDPKDQATYFTTVANRLINSGDPALIREGYKYLEQANAANKRRDASDEDTDLDVRTRSAILEEDTKSSDAMSRASTAQRLATQYEQIKPVGGTPAQIREATLSVIGGEDEISLLREEVSALAASRALSRVPPGPASDKDILFAQRGFPSEFTNAETMAKFLRGFAKMEALKAAYHDHRANYLATKPSAAGHQKEWMKYRNENMAQILEEYGYKFNTETIDEELQKQETQRPNTINVSSDFEELSRDSAVDEVVPRSGPIGGRAAAARRQ